MSATASIESILRSAPTDDSTRADAWEAFHSASSKDDLTTRLLSLNLPSETKADMWEMFQPKGPTQSMPPGTFQTQPGGRTYNVRTLGSTPLAPPPGISPGTAAKARVGLTEYPQELQQSKNEEAVMLPAVGATVMSEGGPTGMGAGAAAGELLKPFLTGRKADVAQAAYEGAGAAVTGKVLEFAGGLLGKVLRSPWGDKMSSVVENLFRAIPSERPTYRANVIAALPDLQKIARSTVIPENAAGGIISPDMRPRWFADQLDDYLSTMYHTEREGQIAAAARAGGQVNLTMDPDALTMAMRRFSNTQSPSSPSFKVAQKLLLDPRAPVPIGEADELARSVNQALRNFESSAGPEQAHAAATQRTIALLTELDQDLSQGINGRLKALGQPGIEDYERRYASLATVRDSITRMMNDVERSRLGGREIVSGGMGGIRERMSVPVGKILNSPGRMIENAFNTLKDMPDLHSLVTGPFQPPPIAGQLPPTRTPLITPLPENLSAEASGPIRGGVQPQIQPLAENRQLPSPRGREVGLIEPPAPLATNRVWQNPRPLELPQSELTPDMRTVNSEVRRLGLGPQGGTASSLPATKAQKIATAIRGPRYRDLADDEKADYLRDLLGRPGLKKPPQ